MASIVKQSKVAGIIRTWLPQIISLVVNVYLIGFKLGEVNTQMEGLQKHVADKDVHMPLERKFELLVSRREYSAKMAMRDSQIAELRALLINQGHKLDRIWERLADNKNS